MAYELTGTIKLIREPQTFASGFTKREVVVTSEEGRFPQDILFECVKEKTALLDNVREGDRVKVSFDIRGREYNGRYFNNLSVWKLEKADAADAAGTPAAAAPVPVPPPSNDLYEDPF